MSKEQGLLHAVKEKASIEQRSAVAWTDKLVFLVEVELLPTCNLSCVNVSARQSKSTSHQGDHNLGLKVMQHGTPQRGETIHEDKSPGH